MMRRTQHIKIRTKSSADNGNSKGERPVIGVNSRRPGGRPGVSKGPQTGWLRTTDVGLSKSRD